MTDDTSGRRVDRRSGSWIVIRQGRGGRWGGELRRHYIFDRLAARTDAAVTDDRHPWRLQLAAGGIASVAGLTRPHGQRPRLAASEKLRDPLLEVARRWSDPAVVAIYDDPIAQAQALDVALAPEWEAEVRRRQARSIETFRWLVAPTASFAALAGLDPARVIVGGNGTDTRRIRPGPWPVVPTVGVVSAAAPGRGLEVLIEAAEAAREAIPELRLRLWLVAMNPVTRGYLDALRGATADRPWIGIGTAPYDRLGEALASASVLAIPHPPGDYMDVALPVKLFDSAAAGRALVVTPRVETAAVVRAHGIGIVAGGDAPADLAQAIVELLGDDVRLHSLGGRARAVAEQAFDWRVVGDRIADAVLAREGQA